MQTKDNMAYSGNRSASAVSDFIILQAKRLYEIGVNPATVSLSQVEAVGLRINGAKDFHAAITAVTDFLNHQMSKLDKKSGNGDERCSWLKLQPVEGRKTPLGGLVIQWMENRRYLPEGIDLQPPALLSALKRFWNCVSVFYRYRRNTGESVEIEEKQCR